MKICAIGHHPLTNLRPKREIAKPEQNKALAQINVRNKTNYQAYSPNLYFTGFNCSPDNFDVKRAFGIECPCCGQVMPTKKQVTCFVNRVGDKKGKDLQKELRKGADFFRPNEAEIAGIIIATSEEYPDADLNEVVALNAKNSIQELEETQSEILDEMFDEARNLDEATRLEVEEELNKTKECIYSKDEDKHFKRKDFTERITQIAENSSENNQGCLKRLVEMAEDMPTSSVSKDAFFVKYSRRSNKEIAERLMYPAMVTTEHIRPKSKNGQNSTDNYIPLCGTCNSARGNTPYNEWFEDHPEMRENLQKYIEKISGMIENGEFARYEYYETYVDEVIEAIKDATEGALILTKPKEANETDAIEATTEEEEIVEETPEQMREGLMRSYNKIQKEISALMSRRAELEKDEEFQNIRTYKKVSSELRSIKPIRDNKRREYLATKGRLRSKEETLQQERQEGDAEKIKALEARCEELRIHTAALKEDYLTVNAQYLEINARYEEAKSKITLPDEIGSEITSIKKKLQELENAKKEVETLTSVINSEDELELVIELANLNVAIKENEEESEEKDKQVQRKKAIERKLGSIDRARKKLKTSKLKYKYLSGTIDQPELTKRLEVLLARKAELNYKFHNININEQIAIKQKEADEILQRYVESYEEEAYQHSYPRVEELASKSSSS